MKTDPMQVLASIGAHTATSTAALLDILCAVMLERFGETSVEFTRDDLMRVAERYSIERTIDAATGKWFVRIAARGDPDQAKLPLSGAELAEYPESPFATGGFVAGPGGSRLKPGEIAFIAKRGETPAPCVICDGLFAHRPGCPSDS
jgi:hypothetical protein